MLRNITLIFVLVALITNEGCKDPGCHKPILLLAAEEDFGSYTGEILRAEGFNEYILKSVSDDSVTASYIGSYDIVVLAQQNIGPQKTKILKTYVKQGGNLIAFCPDSSLSDIFGITPAGQKITDGYISIDISSPEGMGLVSVPIQVHGQAVKYSTNEGRVIASFCNEIETREGYPALTANNYGNGHTYAFAYNLPQNIVYTRQGNPASAGIEKDGINGLRAMDLFTDGWLDNSKNTFNQADIQMNLLSHCIESMTAYSGPFPRLWYFPDTLESLVTLTNDGEFRNESDFETQFNDIDSAGAEMSLYVMETKKITRGWTDKWIAKGFEISGHPDDTHEAGNPRWSEMNSVLGTKMTEMTDLFGITMKTIVNHWFVWCGTDSLGNSEFASQAAIEANHGLELDINYAHYDNGSNQGHFLGETGMQQGNFTGSGLVMKFATSKGKILDIYQHLNNVYDQQYNENHDEDGFFNCFKGLLDRSLSDEAYSCISIKSHNDEYYFSKIPLLKMIDYAKNKGIPVWTAEKLLDFIKTRDEANFTDVNWKGKKLSFQLNTSLKHTSGLSVMLPKFYENYDIETITVDGYTADYIVRTIKGKKYTLFTIKPGTSHLITAQYH